MGRPRTFDPGAVATDVANLVLQRGYDAVGIDDITRATGVGRGSLYRVFGSKAGVIALALAGAVERNDARLAELTALVLASSAALDPLIRPELTRGLAIIGRAGDPELQLGRALLERHRQLAPPTSDRQHTRSDPDTTDTREDEESWPASTFTTRHS